jgi:NADPH:quinone reductase
VALEAPFGPARANKAHERLAEGHVVGKINLAVHDRAI